MRKLILMTVFGMVFLACGTCPQPLGSGGGGSGGSEEGGSGGAGGGPVVASGQKDGG
jgi:hypothetical protein